MSEVGAIAIVNQREDAAAHGHTRLTLVPSLLPCLPVGLDLLALLHVQRFAALIVFERRALEVHSQFCRPSGRGVRAGSPPDPIAQPL
jgi:hypothetical protein